MRRFSYVLVVVSCLFLLTAGYYFSYQLGNSDTFGTQQPQTQETEISEKSLPVSIREKIREEYRLNSRQELYSFLENYSS